MSTTSYLAEEKISKLMMKFSVPCIMSLLVSSLYNIVDQIFIGHGVGYLGNGATNVVFPITVIALAMALMVGDGCAAHLSLCLGRGKTEEAEKSAGTAITVSVLAGIVMMVLFLACTEIILSLFGATENNIEYAREYFRVIAIGVPFYVFTNAMNSIIRADGSPKFAMFSTLIGCIINCIFDPIAIFALHWGMFGAALATILGQIVTALLAAWYMMHCKSFRLRVKDLFSGFSVVLKYLPLGFSSFLTQASIVVTMGVMNNALVRYGSVSEYGADIPLTVFGIVMKVFQIVISFAIGIAAGSQPIVGFNYGAKHYDRVKNIYKTMIRAELVISVIAMLAFEIFPMPIISIFGSESNLYNQFAVFTFRLYLSTIILCCIQKATSVFLQSLGKTVTSFALSLTRDIVVNIGVVLILPHYIGLTGTLLSAPIADIVSFALVILMMRKVFRSFETNSKN
ncbi:MAG: MATE family efflux transporter [Ruminococcus sp.]|nr:MATE family efflux transporter [Ruminococcus sp.]